MTTCNFTSPAKTHAFSWMPRLTSQAYWVKICKILLLRQLGAIFKIDGKAQVSFKQLVSQIKMLIMWPARRKTFVNNAKSKLPMKLQQWADLSLRIRLSELRRKVWFGALYVMGQLKLRPIHFHFKMWPEAFYRLASVPQLDIKTSDGKVFQRFLFWRILKCL